MKTIREIWYKEVHWMDEDYTIGGIVLTFLGVIFFILLTGFLETL